MKLFKYQIDCVDRMTEFGGRSLLALEMGLGKTIITLEWLKRNPESLPALVVCPASVKQVWEYEAFHYAGFRSSIYNGRKPPSSGRGFVFGTPISIINYDILTYWQSYIGQLPFKTVVFDETHALKNPRAKRTKASKNISKRVRNVFALSGTPLVNKPVELYPILNILWPGEYSSFWNYSKEWCNPKMTPWGWDHSGSRNLKGLHEQLKLQGMVRYRKDDVLEDLPDKVRRIVPCKLRKKEEYQQASVDFLGWLRKNSPHKYRSAARAPALAKIGYLLRLAARLKIKGVVEWANRFMEETDQKLILFAVHTAALDVLQRRINVPSVRICGATDMEKRKLAVEKFQKDDKCRLFVGNIQAAGVGLTLTAASEVGFVEMSWRPGDHIQAAARAHRIGQRSTVFENYFVANGTIEEDLCKILQRKQKVLSSVLDGDDQSGDLDIYSELLKALERRISDGG